MVRLLSILMLFVATVSQAQISMRITGRITNPQGEPLQGVTVRISNPQKSSVSSKSGEYQIIVGHKTTEMVFSLTGYHTKTVLVPAQKPAVVDVVLEPAVQNLNTVTVKSGRAKGLNTSPVNASLLQNLPSVSGNFESILKTLPGVSTNNELSSQYSVRGGNFDENLVYVNDVEIYRPFLVRSGQQEGLSFINPELAGAVNFSAGGFEARYGDKMSSVLDVQYARPDSEITILTAGLLGLSATYKGLSKNDKSYMMIGLRKKTNQNILNNQPVVGSYRPDFYDAQLVLGTDFNPKWKLSLMGDYNLSRFNLIPQSRETEFGTQSEVYRLHVDYLGQEADRYETWMASSSLSYKPSDALSFKWINAAFNITEQENADIEGSYIFDEVEPDVPGSQSPVHNNRGIGTYLDHNRNELTSRIYSSEIKGYYHKDRSFWEGGLKFQYDRISDHLHEFSYLDSAGYSLPNNDGPLLLNNVVDADNRVSTSRVMTYLQNTYRISDKTMLVGGLRTNYNSFTEEFLVSPRLGLSYRPYEDGRVTWRFALGAYDQPPFYRELRNFDGTLNKNAQSQRSWHVLAANDYFFEALGTRLKLTSELYYKYLSRLTPYQIDNLRIRYYADQTAKGYAAGADFSLSGEFVEGLESSFRLSFMKTGEKVDDSAFDGGAGYVKRPTDQRVNFSIFFQDRLFNSPTYKVHLNLLYGSALPVGPYNSPAYRDAFKIPAYKRVDIGFSKDIMERKHKPTSGFLFDNFHSLVFYAEVFNLLNIDNTISYLWIKDVANNRYAIPNYLTSRQLNFKIIAKIKNK
ncbi:TonB-dependent receptor plug domain-containing protein [Pedobacter sp. BS3]|uniref:TonB-dependent receptor n=1 Tax=Pedobacter sp. BS3 TaxID=2567937 RepID=UPI0011ED34D0|nr:TonB-dependent receptor [Pedobacter sp. BS3]TZF84784.1 TonB-dependent receptor plug domain-containing protein [Pedobacter sp. BS3]